MSDLYDSIRQIVREELRQSRIAELAVVQEQHPHADDEDTDNYSCTVVLRDNGIVLKKVPVMVMRKGAAAIPDIGDLVLVQFLNGDINAPIIVGSLYNDEDRPPANSSGQAVLQLPLGGGGIELLVDTENSTSVELKVGNGVTLTLIDDDPVVTIDVDSGKAKLEISRDGSVSLNSGNGVEIKSGADMTIEAGGQLNLKGSMVNIN
ncbi:phage baseplate assembly protein V [Hahella ganghwensis]|uniref:phage baseplate assembly protein V n=1 Tax=Hahella ganghwensis TaxID=286420 RepID=UPI0003621184|nr:phage baseplate assembly protein V [Hahella ganghwensis]